MNEIFINKTLEKENKRIELVDTIVNDFIIKNDLRKSLNNFIKINDYSEVSILNIDMRAYNYNYNDKESYLVQVNNNDGVLRYGTCCKDIASKIKDSFIRANILVNVTYVIVWYEGDGFLSWFRKIQCDDSYVKGVVFSVKPVKYLNVVVNIDDLDENLN